MKTIGILCTAIFLIFSAEVFAEEARKQTCRGLLPCLFGAPTATAHNTRSDYRNSSRYNRSQYNHRRAYQRSRDRYYRNSYRKRSYSRGYTLHQNRATTRYKGARVFVFSPKKLRWYAYSNGRLIASGRASGGSHYCKDVGRACRTPVGSFRVHSKRGASCVSNKYPLNRSQPRARMPYCMFFRGGYGVHGSNHVPNYNASHGCIRVHPSAAVWLYRNFMSVGTRVVVQSYR